jgi:hypothetical protein
MYKNDEMYNLMQALNVEDNTEGQHDRVWRRTARPPVPDSTGLRLDAGVVRWRQALRQLCPAWGRPCGGSRALRWEDDESSPPPDVRPTRSLRKRAGTVQSFAPRGSGSRISEAETSGCFTTSQFLPVALQAAFEFLGTGPAHQIEADQFHHPLGRPPSGVELQQQ